MSRQQTPDFSGASLAARQIIDNYGITSPEEIDLKAIAADQGICVMEDTLHGAEARLTHKGSSGIIRVSTAITQLGRKRFAIAHELGHWKRHRSTSRAGVNLCEPGDIHAYRGSPIELEANAFAAELLMPTPLFRPRCETGNPNLEFIAMLASDFDTTLTATAVRLVEERKECVVVFSENEQIRWWKANPQGVQGLWFHKRRSLHPESYAFQCPDSQPSTEGMRQVSPEAWFPDQAQRRNLEVWEDSMVLGEYGIVLTLLWVEEW